MKKICIPPAASLESLLANPERTQDLLRLALDDTRYLHWDELRRRPPPENLTHEEWWTLLKLRRQTKQIQLRDTQGRPFSYGLPDPIARYLHRIDLGAGGNIGMPDPITNPDTKDQYYVGSLIEEAITSSQLEGATTTRRVAKEMIRSGRQPTDRSERMILNNYLTMRRIGELRNEALSQDLVFEIHRLVTDNTLDDVAAAGRFRRDTATEQIAVYHDEELVHLPPNAAELPERMSAMCAFANETPGDGEFLHPAVRSIILHFWLAYDHPFCDGNGRTARALFYWSMLRRGYWLFEFISISRILLKAPAKYGRAFLYTETDDNDLTYFVLYQLKVIDRAVNELHDYIRHKTASLRKLEHRLRGMQALNHRQRAFVSNALRHPHNQYTVESHRLSHNVAYETARSDLLDLVNRGLLTKARVGKRLLFTPPSDLEKRLAD